LMLGAMMLPLVLNPLRTTAFRSLRIRRHRSMALFLAGYLAPWIACGLPVAWIRGFPWVHTPMATAGAFALAALWVPTPMHARALVACHRTMPLAPRGARADRDCLHFGVVIGGACMVSCWALMLACAVSGHSLAAMIGGAAIGACERFSYRPPLRTVLAGTWALAAGYLVAA
jgi:predicted metal-binding membrane protein